MQVETIEFFERLNNSIFNLKTDERTIESDERNFFILHDLYYDLTFARISNKASLAPSEILDKELTVIYEHLIKTINKLYQNQKKKMIQLTSQIAHEELKHPRIDTTKKRELENLFDDIVRLCEFMTVILV